MAENSTGDSRAPRAQRPGGMTLALRWVLVGVIALGSILVIAWVVTALRSGGTAPPGTSVEGVDISGMTPEQAAAAVTAKYQPIARKRIKLTYDGKTYVVKPAEAGLKLDAAASVEPAFGQTWNPADLIGHLFGETTLPLVTTVDQTALNAQVQAVAEALDQPPTNPELEVKAGKPSLTPGVPGRELDQQATSTALVNALLKPRQPIPAPVTTVEPGIADQAAQQASDLAKTAVSAPVTVHADTVTATIPTEAISKALTFTSEGTSFTPQLDGAVLHESIKSELKPLETKGRDASFKIKNGAPVVVPSVVGKGISDEELATAVLGVLSKPADQRTVTVPVGVREPKVTTEEAQAMGIKDKLSSFTQHFPYAAYRVQNIGEAARRINGTILMPGDTFSMNDTIKERTKANGYTKGFVVGEGGVFDEQLGGGVSTATTATWTAAFFAGMERVQTVAHSIYISRYQPGLEATVAWGLFDMKFKNTTGHPVLMRAGITNGSVTVSFWGTKQYDKIDAEFGKRTNKTKYATIYDSSDKCMGQPGVDGFWINVDRVFYKDGKEVKRETIPTHYKPAPHVICGHDPHAKKPSKSSSGSSGSGSSDSSPSASPSSSDKPSAKPSNKPTKPNKPNKPKPKPSADSGNSGGDTFSN